MGIHKNGEIAFSYTIGGDCVVSPCEFNFGNWSDCDSSGFQTRNYTSSPAGCLGTPPADSTRRSCGFAANDFVLVFPNPAKNVINLRFNNNVTNLQTQLINNLGQVIYKGQSNSIDVSKYSTGFYFLKIETNQGKLSKKIMIQH